MLLQRRQNRGAKRAIRCRAHGLVGGVIAIAALAGGCARSSVTSTVKADGSWTRKVVFHGAPDDAGAPSFGTKLEDAFTLPSGVGWKIKREKKEDEVIVTAEREMQAGETLKKDITLLGD